MTEPQLPWLHRPTPTVVKSSQTFLQFGEKNETRRRQIGPIWWVIQDGGTKASNLRTWSRTCVLSSIVKFNEWMLNVRTKSRFQFSQHFKISLWVNVCASTHEFWMRQAFTIPENLGITLIADGVGDALWRNSIDLSCVQSRNHANYSHLLWTILFNNSPLSCLQSSRNCWLMSTYFCFSSRVYSWYLSREHTSVVQICNYWLKLLAEMLVVSSTYCSETWRFLLMSSQPFPWTLTAADCGLSIRRSPLREICSSVPTGTCAV
jgi:hypothetical protein